MTLEENIRELRESLIVTSAQALRHETRLKEHQQWLEDNEMAYARHRAMLVEHVAMMTEIDANMERVERESNARMLRHERNMGRVELALAEATEKLKALIDIVDDRHKRS